MKFSPSWLPSRRVLIVIGIAGATGGCGLAERAEALFMRQQSAQGSLASTVSEVETAQPLLAARLYGLEDDLHMACGPLREASLRRLEGQDLGSDLEWAVVTALQKCETTTSTVEHMVQQAEAGSLGDNPLVDAPSAEFEGR
jgi:hypothetical protein